MTNKNNHYGQALVSLLFFMIIAISISTAAVTLVLNNSIATSKVASGMTAYAVAESGVEEALLRLLRDPNYGNGGVVQNIPVGTNNAAVTVNTAGSLKTITSIGTAGRFSRTLQVVTSYNSITLQLVINSWQETP